MLGRRVLVGVKTHVVRIAPADRDPGRVEHELGVLVDGVALQDDEAAHVQLGLGTQADRCGLLRAEHEALLREAEVTARGAHDSPDEQVEQEQEEDLQDQKRLADRNRGKGHSASLRSKESPRAWRRSQIMR